MGSTVSSWESLKKCQRTRWGAPCAESGPVIELKNAKLHLPPPSMYEKNR